ncbi:MAG: hypothetical protein LBT27_00910 [Prevotellaceae bacterium]|jgi:hypothetical protein|nr:hypothetical protein [Prevotellaceae bacterium]
MRLLNTKPYYSDAELLKKLHSEKNINIFKSWQIIYAIQTNPNSKAVDSAIWLQSRQNVSI